MIAGEYAHNTAHCRYIGTDCAPYPLETGMCFVVNDSRRQCHTCGRLRVTGCGMDSFHQKQDFEVCERSLSPHCS